MRIWSVHPRYLDRQALVACWRESLLAQAVIAGRTRGYTRHPQLERFRSCADPSSAIGGYLHSVADEADARGYRFDRSRIDSPAPGSVPITVTAGQLDLEFDHLMTKLRARSPDLAMRWREVERPDPHPSFTVVPGEVEHWERAVRSRL
ncbi:pyrimidine dimer DNA glycosylase/endonuclease V [Tsukamurella serpentis]